MSTRIERERKQQQNEHYKKILAQLLAKEDNKYCADCMAKGPRWVSWNLGVFLCIRCSGIHRSLGVHISKVKSVTLDTWTSDQVLKVCSRGNGWGKEKYEATLPRDFKRPQTDSTLEYFIRDKYEKSKYSTGKEVPLRSIEEYNISMNSESPNLQRDRKRNASNGTAPVSIRINRPVGTSIPRPRSHLSTTPTQQTAKQAILNGVAESQAIPPSRSNMDDLLGLNSPSAPVASTSQPLPPSADLTFDLFTSMTSTNNNVGTANEQTYFANVETPAPQQPVETKRMSKDSILSLYSQNNAVAIQANPYMTAGAYNVPCQTTMAYGQPLPMAAPTVAYQAAPMYNMQPGMMAYPQQQNIQAMQQQYQWQQQQMQLQMQNMQLAAGYPPHLQSVAGMRSYSSMPQMSPLQSGYQYPVSTGSMLTMPQHNQLVSSQPSLVGLEASSSNFPTVSLNSGQTLSTHLWK